MSSTFGVFLSPANLEGIYKDAKFPCSKQDLLNIAEQHDAPQQAIDVIDRLPDKQYNSVQEVTSEALKSAI